MPKTVRFVQQTERQRIESNLVLTRIGRLMLRGIEALARGTLYEADSKSAVIIEGLEASPGSGLSVDLSRTAVALQNIGFGGDNDLRYVIDDNDGSNPFNVTLDPADGTNDRIDIIEARIEERSEFTDNAVQIVDATTKTVSSQTRDRDFEIFINLRKNTGTPAGSPVPPSPTAATAGTLLGTVTTDVLDLSSEYIFNFAIGPDKEYVEVDLRGATPSATTRAERITAISNAITAQGFDGTVSNVGGAIQVQANGTGENSIVKVKQPSDPTIDALNEVFGVAESPGYVFNYAGDNAFFKVAEIFVPTGAITLTAGNVRSRLDKDTQWDSDAGTIINGVSLSGHRTASELDHPDGSVFLKHLSQEVIDQINAVDIRKEIAQQGLRNDIQDDSILDHELRLSNLDGVQTSSQNLYSDSHTDNTKRDLSENNADLEVKQVTSPNPNRYVQEDDSSQALNSYIKPRERPFLYQHVSDYVMRTITQGLGGGGAGITYDSVRDCYWVVKLNGTATFGDSATLMCIDAKLVETGNVQVTHQWTLDAITGPSELYRAPCFFQESTKSYLLLTALESPAQNGRIVKLFINNAGDRIGRESGNLFSPGQLIDVTNASNVENDDTTVDGPFQATEWDNDNLLICEYDGRLVWRKKSDLTLAAVPLSIPTMNGPTNITDVTLTMDTTNILTSLAGIIKVPGQDVIYLVAATDTGGPFDADSNKLVKVDFNDDVLVVTGTPTLVNVSGATNLSDEIIPVSLTIGDSGDLYSFDFNSLVLARYALKGTLEHPGTLKSMRPLAGPSGHVAVGVDSNSNYWSGDTAQAINTCAFYRVQKDGTTNSVTLTGRDWVDILGAVFVSGRGASNPGSTGTTEWCFLVGQDNLGNFEVVAVTRANLESNFGGSYDLTGGLLSAGVGAATTDALQDITFDGTDLFVLDDTNGVVRRITMDTTTFGTDDQFAGTTGVGAYTVEQRTYVAGTRTSVGLAYKNERFYVHQSTFNDPTGRRIIYVIDRDRSDDSHMFTTKFLYQNIDLANVSAQTETDGRIDFDGDDIVSTRPQAGTGYDRFTKFRSYEGTGLSNPIIQTWHGALAALVEPIDPTNKIGAEPICVSPIAKRRHGLNLYSDPRNRLPGYSMLVGMAGGVEESEGGVAHLNLDRYLTTRNFRDIRVREWHSTTSVRQTALGYWTSSGNLATNIWDLLIIDDLFLIGGDGGSGFGYTQLNNVNAEMYMHTAAQVDVGHNITSFNRRNQHVPGRATTIGNSQLLLSGNNIGTVVGRILNNDDTNNHDQLFVALGTLAGGTDLVKYSNGNPLTLYNNVYNNLNVGQKGPGPTEARANPMLYLSPSGDLFGLDPTAAVGIALISPDGLQTIPVTQVSTDTVGEDRLTSIVSGRGMAVNPIVFKMGGIWRHFLPIAIEFAAGTVRYFLVDFENNSLDQIYAHTDIAKNAKGMDVLDEYIKLAIDHDSGFQAEIIQVEKYKGAIGTVGFSLNNWGREGIRESGHGRYGNTSVAGPFPQYFMDATPPLSRVFQVKSSPDLNTVLCTTVAGVIFEHFDNSDESLYTNNEEQVEGAQPTAYKFVDNIVAKKEYIVDADPIANGSETDGASEVWQDDPVSPSHEVARKINEDGTTEGFVTWQFTGYEQVALDMLYAPDGGVMDVELTEDPGGSPTSVVIGYDGATTLKIDTHRASALAKGEADAIMIAEGLDSTKTYEIKVSHASTAAKEQTGETGATYTNGHNDSATGPDYPITVIGLWLYKAAEVDVRVNLTLKDSAFPADAVTVQLTRQTPVASLVAEQSFNGDGIATEFTISGTNHALRLNRYSRDNGVTWLNRDDPTISWGSNAPNYDDETVDGSKQFTVKDLAGAPSGGPGTVKVEFIISFDSWILQDVIEAHKNGADYFRLGNIKRTGKVLELIPDVELP